MEAPMSPNAPLGPPPPGVVSDFSHPVNQMRYDQIVATLAIMFALSTSCVLLRVYTRLIIKQFGWDDAFAVLSMILNVLMTVGWIQQIKYGIADYDWNVRAMQWLTEIADSYNYWNAVGSIVFYIVYALLKMSILCLFLRLIGHTKRVLRMCVFALMFITCVGTLGSIIAILKMCTNVEKLFHPLTASGTCTFNVQIFIAQALFSVVTDVLILVPPIPIIWTMTMSPMRKFGLAINVSLGLIVTGFAIVRALYWNKKVVYVLSDNYYGIYWAILEVNLALAAVCLPALTQLFRRQRQRSRTSKESPIADTPDAPSGQVSNGRRAPRIPTVQMPGPMSQIDPENFRDLKSEHIHSEKRIPSRSSGDGHSVETDGSYSVGTSFTQSYRMPHVAGDYT